MFLWNRSATCFSFSFFFSSVNALELSWTKSGLLRFKPKSCASCRNPTAEFYFFRCRIYYYYFFNFKWLFTLLTFKEMMLSFPIVYKTFPFPANVIYFFANPPPARVVLCYSRFHTLVVNTFWLQEGEECNSISNLCNFLPQINTFNPVRKVQTEHKQNNLFLQPSENFQEKKSHKR